MINEFNEIVYAIHGVLMLLLLASALVSVIILGYVYVWKNRKTEGLAGDYWLSAFEAEQRKIKSELHDLSEEIHTLKEKISLLKNVIKRLEKLIDK